MTPNTKRQALLFTLCWIAICSARAELSCDVAPATLDPGTVARVVDGDTLHLVGGEKVRLIGINTPELGRGKGRRPAQPLAVEATAALVTLIGPTMQVLLRNGREARDSHGRRLVHVYDLGGRSLVAQLLRRGMGFHVAIAPNTDNASCLEQAEAEAVGAGLGVWGLPAYNPCAVRDLAPRQGGFALVRDRVTRVSFKRRAWWVQLGGKVGLRIKPRDQQLFSRAAVRALEGQILQARGWLVPMDGGWWLMDISHPLMLGQGE